MKCYLEAQWQLFTENVFLYLQLPRFHFILNNTIQNCPYPSAETELATDSMSDTVTFKSIYFVSFSYENLYSRKLYSMTAWQFTISVKDRYSDGVFNNLYMYIKKEKKKEGIRGLRKWLVVILRWWWWWWF